MTPEEVDTIVGSVTKSVCSLCAIIIEDSGSVTCPDCMLHLKEQDEHSSYLPRAESLAELLGLTRTNFLGKLKFTDKVVKHEITDRMMRVFPLLNEIRQYSEARKCIIWTRYCTLFLSHTADILAASLGNGPLASLDCFILVLGALRTSGPWTRFLLSDDPRARSANKLAVVMAEQFILHSPRWEKQADLVPQPPVTFLVMQHVCLLLGHIVCVQVDKSAALRLPEEVRSQVQAILARWDRKWSDKKPLKGGILMAATAITVSAPGDTQYLVSARGHRDEWEGMQRCAREGCSAAEDLYQCSRCYGALYCSRQHQSDHWKADPLPHRQICYRRCF